MIKVDGYFINLDRSEDRRASMNRQLEDLGCGHFIRRFPAVNGALEGPFDNTGQNGVWACRRSHEQVILQADEASATVILEDDVDISRHFPDIINEGVISNIIDSTPELDIFFLDCSPFFDQIPLLIRTTERYMRNRKIADAAEPDRHQLDGIGFPDARTIYAFCAAGYVVTPKGKASLRRLFEATQEAHMPIDILYRDWIASGALKANITVPFLVTPKYMSQSTIEYGELDQAQLLGERQSRLTGAIRRMLFASNPGIVQDEVEPLLCDAPASPEYRLTMRMYESLWAAQ
ncbi:Glycosyltransferase family 25 (LPS biosynthesis protein) [Caballeronia arvi]|uniref:Glycosyltransferase family 25 (LPS biosynthesis protein) n=1 Tax=Caballeronia arvi TaxID=1777135 RepID=A0A158KLM8_9BURK|nr:hypothetical protein [Caballeronia arvi]SAL82046.1 Glycosyltransferase family 25 (LPS biosynthesis protein) [Caballeronia arvi]